MRGWWRTYWWAVAGAVGLAALILGMIGFVRRGDLVGQPAGFLDSLYLSLQLFVLQSGAVTPPLPWELQVARLAAPAATAYTAVSGLAVLFREQLQRLRARRLEGHVIVCGLGRKGLLLSRSLRAQGQRVVAVERDAENDLIDAARSRGVMVLVGDARDPETLRRAGVARAAHLVAVTGDDGVNAEISVRARSMVRADRTPLGCLVHIVDPQLCTLLRMQEIERDRGEELLRLDFFNVFEGGARQVVAEFPPFAGTGGGHVVVVGLGRMGESVVVQAARESHRGGGSGRPRISVVDRAAAAKVEALALRAPRVAEAVTLEACEMAIESADFERAGFLAGPDGNVDVSAVYVCVDDDSLAMSAALSLHRHLRACGIPVVVRMAHDAGLASLLRGRAAAEGGFESLHAFGLLDRTCGPDLLLGTNEVLARAMHEEYRRTRTGAAADPAGPSMAPWEELAETLRESNRDQAADIGAKLAAVGCDLAPLDGWDEDAFAFSPAEVELLGRMEHERWVAERRRGGWTPAADKDVERRTTPYLVAWRDLPEEVREEDRMFVRRLPAFLARVGFRIVRMSSSGG